MGYLVLARKWRPRTFAELKGQSVIKNILINSLNKEQPHHAYIFSGTRGVGKTSLARILAKALNCQQGITANPCGHCQNCTEIDQGTSVDLIEIDAASRTKVEDTRELLNNIHYAPHHSRFKIFLIDEVHMLSNHSFNALLKTLEEPPPHVTFILATTDPQKLPATVLSRCLRLHLQPLSINEIQQQLQHILNAESMPYEDAALQALAQAAKGSLRDALSLLDQAIAYSDNPITALSTQTLLGHLPENKGTELLVTVAQQDTAAMCAHVEALDQLGIDFNKAIDSLLSLLHQLALDRALDKNSPTPALANLSAEDIQLYYQIALHAKKDLSLAPTPKLGFEMMLLRMLAFHPKPRAKPSTDHRKEATATANKAPEQSTCLKNSEKKTPQQQLALTAEQWQPLLNKLALSGMTKILASHCIISKVDKNKIQFTLSRERRALLNPQVQQRLQQALQTHFNTLVAIAIELEDDNEQSPKAQTRVQVTSKKEAQHAIESDQTMKDLLRIFDAEIDPSSISPNEDDFS